MNSNPKPDIRSRIKKLHKKIESFQDRAPAIDLKTNAKYALNFLERLDHHVEKDKPVFGVEPWHPMAEEGTFLSPGEYLLRIEDDKGELIPPYPAIMTFYDNGYMVDIDTIIFLCALAQFKEDNEPLVSINISARSLHATDFTNPVLEEMKAMGLAPNKPERIIIEIHESSADIMKRDVLEMFQNQGASFAIDDVGLSISDVFRLSEFDGIADYIKIDRKAVLAERHSTHSLDHVMSFVRSLLPGVIVVAEGVKTVEHAFQIFKVYPDIDYVQGMELPDRDMFTKRWRALIAADQATG